MADIPLVPGPPTIYGTPTVDPGPGTPARPGAGLTRGDPHNPGGEGPRGRKPAPPAAPPPPGPSQTAAPDLPPVEPVEEVRVSAPRPSPPPITPVVVSIVPNMQEIVVTAPRPRPKPRPKVRPRRKPKKPAPSRRRRPKTPQRLPSQPAPLRFRLPVLGLASLVPTLIEQLAKLDEGSTQNVYDRIYGGGADDEQDTSPSDDGRSDLGDGSQRLDSPPEDLEEIVVSSRRPGGNASPRPVGAPVGLPAPTLLPISLGFQPNPVSLTAVGRPSPTPRRRPSPEPVTPFGAPLSVLAPEYFTPPGQVAPLPRPGRRPRPQPVPSPLPQPAPTPIAGPRPGTTNPAPLTWLNPGQLPFPQAQADRCPKCPQPKKRKPRKPRAECRRGTYVETATSTVKKPTEVIPCQ